MIYFNAMLRLPLEFLTVTGMPPPLKVPFISFLSCVPLKVTGVTILMLLENCPEEDGPDHSLSPSDLAEMCGVSRASISGLVDGLAKDGMVLRGADKRDGRGRPVRITAKGKRFLDKMLPAHFTWLARVMQNLDEDERHQLIALVSKIDPNVKP